MDDLRIILKETKKLRLTNLPRGTIELLYGFLTAAGIYGTFYLIFLRRITGSSHLKGVNLKSFADDHLSLSLQPGGNDTCQLFNLVPRDEWKGRAEELYHKLGQHQEFLTHAAGERPPMIPRPLVGAKKGGKMKRFDMDRVILRDEDVLGLILEAINGLSGKERRFIKGRSIVRELIDKKGIFSSKEFPSKALGHIPNYLSNKSYLEKAGGAYRLSDKGIEFLVKQGFIKEKIPGKEISADSAALIKIFEESVKAAQEFENLQAKIDKIDSEIRALEETKDRFAKEQAAFAAGAERYKKIREVMKG